MTAPPDTDREEAERWLKQAQEHYVSADWATQGRQWPNACFLYQQAGELALKALLIRSGQRVRIHGLLHLVELLRPNCADIDQLADLARSLDRFYIPTRYPDALPTGTSGEYFKEHQAQEARAAAHDVLAFVRTKLTSW